MTIELARLRKLPKPWGVVDLRPWSKTSHDGLTIGEICFERSSPSVAEPTLLLKVLLTRQPLSIQVHPDDATARSMGLPNGKTEAWYVLRAETGASVALGFKHAMSAPQLGSAIADGSIAELVVWRGVAAGDAITVPPGTIHAIGAGLVIAEIQQRSDTTFRLFDYGRNREIHPERALAAARTELTVTSAPLDRLSSERTLLAANAHFVFERIELAPESNWCLEAARETWLLVVGGTARAGVFDVDEGDALFAQSDRIPLRTGLRGVVCIIAYSGAGGPIPELLQQLHESATDQIPAPCVVQVLPLSRRAALSSSIMETNQ